MSIIGSLQDLSLADIIQVIAGSQKTGVLYVNTNDGRSSIVFKNGFVVSASRPDLAHRLGQLLVKQRDISDADLDICLREQARTNLPLGEILLKRGMISADKLIACMKQQVIETVNQIVNLGEGSFSFQSDAQLPADLVFFDPHHILLDVAYLQDTRPGPSGFDSSEPFLPSRLVEGNDEDSGTSRERESLNGEGRCIHLLRELSEELARPRESTEVSLLVLRLASEYFDRCLFLLVSDSQLIVRGGFGFSLQHPPRLDASRRIVIPLRDGSIFKTVYETHQSYRGSLLEGEWGKGLIARLSDRLPSEIAVFPVVNQGNVISILYGDNGESQQRIPDTDLLEVLLLQAGMALENESLRERLMQLAPFIPVGVPGLRPELST
ncbi:MAG: DUF4388 domain-containing protein [Acidobacteriota bacterium]